MNIMKKTLIFLFLFIGTINFVYSTEQKADFLIIGNDTICLKSFPMEELDFKVSPFKYGENSFSGTNCWRGYQATWKVVDHKLFLVEIARVDTIPEKLDIENYFRKNNYTPTIINGLIYADWFTANLEEYTPRTKDKLCLFKPNRPYKNSKTLIKIEKGVMIENNIKED